MVDTAALNEAYEEAVGEDADNLDVEEAATGEEEVIEKDVVEEVDIEKELPQDHKERSNLGRKIETLFQKSDKQDEVMERMMNIIESQQAPKAPPPDANEYVTKGELHDMQQRESQATAKYESDFKATFHALAEDLSKEDKAEIEKILVSDFNLKESNNGTLDGSKAYNRATKAYFSKQTPLQNERASGVTTRQTVKSREKPLAKLDKWTKAYLDNIKETRGVDAALRAHKSLGEKE